MAIDPKNTGVRLPVSLPTTTKPATPAKADTWSTPAKPTGFVSTSEFEGSTRTLKESFGRSSKDDSVGRSSKDDSVGRSSKDDSVGRSSKDDSVGMTSDGYAIVGRETDRGAIAQQRSSDKRLETASFLTSGAIAPQVQKYAESKLNAAQLTQLSAVLKNASPATAGLVGALLEKKPGALSETDSRGATLLSNLATIASGPLNAKLSGNTNSDAVLQSALREIVNPERIDQGDAPTCTVTSMQYELVKDEPAEYARIISDLTSAGGKSPLRNGGDLSLVGNSADPRALTGRSVTESVFQSAAMNYGAGADVQYDAIAQKSVNQTTGAEQRGLRPAQQTQMLRQLFGVNYASEVFETAGEGAKAFAKLKALNYDSAGAKNRPIILQLDQGSFNHAVTYEKIADGQVFFRDPYGVQRALPEAQFANAVVAMNAPRDLKVIA